MVIESIIASNQLDSKLTQTQISLILAAWDDPTYLAAKINAFSGFCPSACNGSHRFQLETGGGLV
jgi:hypothetical protein